MSSKVRRTAYLLQRELQQVEQGSTRQIGQVAGIIATMCEASLETGANAHVGHAAILRAREAFNLQVDAFDSTTLLHAELSRVAGVVGVQELAIGGGDKPPLPINPSGLLPVEEHTAA